MQHDLADGIPAEFETCDVIYSEPPWPAGYSKFHDRVGVTPRYTYAEWLSRLNADLDRLGKPWVMLAGKPMHRYLTYDRLVTVKLYTRRKHTGEFTLAVRGDVGDLGGAEGSDTPAVIRQLAARFNRVGDPCCGYGRTGKIFREFKKSFVMSDVSAECIGYIADQNGWSAP